MTRSGVRILIAAGHPLSNANAKNLLPLTYSRRGQSAPRTHHAASAQYRPAGQTLPPSPLAASALLSGAVVGKVSPTSTAALASKMRYRVCEIAALLQRAAGRHSCPGSRSLSGPLLAPASLSRGYLQTPRCRFPDPPPSCFSTAHPPGGRNPVTPVCDSPLLLPAVDQSYLSELLGAIIPHAKCETANGRSVTMDHSSLQSRRRLRSLLFRSSISCA